MPSYDLNPWEPLMLQLPSPTTIRPSALAITVAALVMVSAGRWSVLRTLGGCAVLGLLTAAPNMLA
ncbi:hypothetical protein [Yinghuangia sp. YIM S10712]|uniref:hypothetical protein n=1 Tax=Yinghuangia sp. YIM S10712 TaxID=3436930 RepID=UPI003F533203